MKLKHNYVTVCDVIVEDDPQGFTPFLESGEMCGFLVKYNTRSVSDFLLYSILIYSFIYLYINRDSYHTAIFIYLLFMHLYFIFHISNIIKIKVNYSAEFANNKYIFSHLCFICHILNIIKLNYSAKV